MITKNEKDIIKKTLRRELKKGTKKFAIYPYGQYGVYAEEVLQAEGITEILIADNHKKGEGIVDVDCLLERLNEDNEYVVLILLKDSFIQSQMKEYISSNARNRIILRKRNVKEVIGNIKEQRDWLIARRKGLKMVKHIANNPFTLYVFAAGHIGDAVTIAAFAGEAKRMYGLQKLALVCGKAYQDVGKLFDEIDECIPLSKEERHWLDLCNYQNSMMYGRNYIIGNYGKLFYETTSYFDNRTVQYKSLILQIPSDTPPARVSKKILQEIMERESRDERIICISPYASTFKLLPEDFWNQLVKELKNLGYTVLTNVYGKERELAGTSRYEKPLYETLLESARWTALISYRSGFSDYMAFNYQLPHFVIYPDERSSQYDDISLYGTENASSYVWRDDFDGLIKKIIDRISEYDA